MSAQTARRERSATSMLGVLMVSSVAALLSGAAAAQTGDPIAAAAVLCVGDCDGNDAVSIDEVVIAIRIALGSDAPGLCLAANADGAAAVGIDDVLQAIRNSLDGCPAPSWGFRDVTADAGLHYVHGYATGTEHIETQVAAGVAAGDIDGDGYVDLYAVRGDIGPNLLFRNRGDGTFDEIGAAAGVALTGTKGSGPVFADFDGDGHLDLFVGGVLGTVPRLFRNRGDLTFDDVTAISGLAAAEDTIGAAFGDYDRDGDLDLFLTHWSNRSITQRLEHLWRNNGDGTFTPVDLLTGLGDLRWDYFGLGLWRIDLTFTPNFADIDNDGWPDILLVADAGNSRAFLNRRDGTFADVTAPVISDDNGMGAAVGDYDNDGDLDWFVSSIADPNGVAEGLWGVSGNRLYRNRGDGTFEDATDAAGVRSGWWGWGSCFADFDDDGFLDLFHVNGYGRDSAELHEFINDPSVLFLSNGDGTFTEQAAARGIADRGSGRGVVCADFDRDGDIDVFIANSEQPPHLYRNDARPLHSLTIRLRGHAPNSEAIGGRVYVTAGGQTQMRELRAGSNYVSQDPAEAHFGLGQQTVADRVRVVWPDGEVTIRDGVAHNQVLVLQQP